MNELIGGLDEVGYGAWAGPIISVVAVFSREALLRLPRGVTDSKRLSESARSSLFTPLCRTAVDVGIGHVWPWEIDTIGVSGSLQVSYARALEDLTYQPDTLIVDGTNRVSAFGGEQIIEPKADLNHQQVSAASIIAKHFRDQIMIDLGKAHPAYNWAGNKGYGTADHEQAIFSHGLLVDQSNHDRYIHRRLYTRKVMRRKPA